MSYKFNPFTQNLDLTGSGGSGLTSYARATTLVIAASNAKDTTNADYVCTGTNDHTTFASAIAALPASGGKILLSEGNFSFGAEVNITTSNVSIEGQGNATIIGVKNSANIRSAIAITGSTIYVKLRRFCIDGNKANQTSGSGLYIKNDAAAVDSDHVFEDLVIQNCKNDGLKIDTGNANGSMYFFRVHTRTCNGSGINDLAVTDSVFEQCISETNAQHGFYIGGVDNHYSNCKAFFNGSATGNYHGFYLAGYNNYFVNCQAQDNYQSGFYTQNDGDVTYGAQNCTFVNCDADSNNQSLDGSYGVGFQLKNVSGWILIGCQAYVRPYASAWAQRLGVSLEGTTAKTQMTNLQGIGNTSALYANTASGSGNVLYGLNAAGSRIIIDGGGNDLEFDNLPELFWNQANPDISLYSGSDNRLDVLNGGGGKGNLNAQNILTFGYGDYLGVSPTSNFSSGTHKLLGVSFTSQDQVDLYTPGNSRATSLLTLMANAIMYTASDVKMGFGQSTNITSLVHVNGAIATAILSKTANYTLTINDSVVLANAAGGIFTLTLPDATGCTGRRYTIKKTDSSTNTVTIATTSAQTIDGSTTVPISVQYVSVDLVSDGTNWQVI